MSSKYQMWLTHNGGKEKIQLPYLPEAITIKSGTLNDSVQIAGLGEITIKQDRPALTIQFSSFFPAVWFPGVGIKKGSLKKPESLVAKIEKWKNSKKPARFLITGTNIKMYCTIENFTRSEEGGDVGTIYYSMTLKEYRSVTVRKVKIKVQTRKAQIPAKTKTRTNNKVQPKTHTVANGDSLWKIAAKYLGNGNRYMEIFNLNKDKIKNPNLIYPGQVLKIP